jgi:hypothetical protein
MDLPVELVGLKHAQHASHYTFNCINEHYAEVEKGK